MRKLKPSTIGRKELQKKRMEEYAEGVAEAQRQLDSLCCKTPQDPYSDERDYKMMGEGDGR